MESEQLELRDVVRRFAPAYVAGRGGALLPSQRKALSDIVACRTSALGGRFYQCDGCGTGFWHYHGCRNRACPACHGRRIREWVEAREAQLLGCNYFHVVATVPAELRRYFLSDQKKMYSLLMKTAAECLMELAADRRYLGATPAIMATLHTWARDLNYHPHVHLLVSAGGVSPDCERWVEPRYGQWLVPIRALSARIRKRFRKKLLNITPEIVNILPARVWRQGWNVYCKPCGAEPEAVVNYLGRYVFRTAITNGRIESMNATHVTIRVRSRKKNHRTTRVRLRGEEFLRRFVMHVLPKGFQKVRYYGLWHHSRSEDQERVAYLMRKKKQRRSEDEPCQDAPETVADLAGDADLDGTEHGAKSTRCPCCGSSKVRLVEEITRDDRRIRSP